MQRARATGVIRAAARMKVLADQARSRVAARESDDSHDAEAGISGETSSVPLPPSLPGHDHLIAVSTPILLV